MYYLRLFLSQIKCSSWCGTFGTDNFSIVKRNGNKKTIKERGLVALLVEDFM